MTGDEWRFLSAWLLGMRKRLEGGTVSREYMRVAQMELCVWLRDHDMTVPILEGSNVIGINCFRIEEDFSGGVIKGEVGWAVWSGPTEIYQFNLLFTPEKVTQSLAIDYRVKPGLPISNSPQQ